MTGRALPTFDEIPSLRPGDDRDAGEFMRLSLLPHDDVLLRAAAVKYFLLDELVGNEVAEDDHQKEFEKARLDMSSTPARTPGGIAWKLAKVLDYFSENKDWGWWRYLLRSAMADAIELERARQAPPPKPAG